MLIEQKQRGCPCSGQGTFLMPHLQDLNDLQLCVHHHDVLSLRFSLCFNHVSLWLMGWCGVQQATASKHNLCHQLPNSMNGLHHVTATCVKKNRQK